MEGMPNVAKLAGDTLLFMCPGCGCHHACSVRGGGAVWSWNGDVARPTLGPSVLIRTGHYVHGWKGDTCWCTWNGAHPDEPAPFTCSVCHSFVVDGQIQFLGDCTHALAGQTVPLTGVS